MSKQGRPRIEIPEDVLADMASKFTFDEMLGKLDVSDNVLRRHLRQYHITPRPTWSIRRGARPTQVACHGKRGRRPARLKRSLLRELAKSMTPREIAAKLNVRDDFVRQEMRRHRVRAFRKHGGAVASFSREQLVQLYYARDLTIEQMAEELGCGPRLVRAEMERHLIAIKKVGGKNKHDLTGRDFHQLHVEREVGRVERHIVWLCRCSCGNMTTATTSMLNAGLKKSCGCRLNGHKQNGEFTHAAN